jgi:hypothetical protein
MRKENRESAIQEVNILLKKYPAIYLKECD